MKDKSGQILAAKVTTIHGVQLKNHVIVIQQYYGLLLIQKLMQDTIFTSTVVLEED